MLACPEQRQSAFETAVLEGLSNDQKYLPCQWLYDQRGSELFEAITHLPEYYPTRTETAILKDRSDEIAEALGPRPALIEYGAGASVKTRILLDAIGELTAYAPIDVSSDFLMETAQQVRRDYPGLTVQPIIANFLDEIALPKWPENAPRVGFFPGSTIGNLSDLEIQHFLIRARQTLGLRAQFILGYDLRKSADILIPAYDDAQGVTAAFNLNLLERINRELQADFEIGQFEHQACWNDRLSRMEMHLVSRCTQTVRLAGQSFRFTPGETIHTENSRKFTEVAMRDACMSAGWSTLKTYTDPDHLFAVAHMQVA